MEKRPGYIAISRDIFEHPLLTTRKPYSAREAWMWLINAAAWKPRGHRWRFGVLHLERGELASSVRELAKRWSWPKSTVHRFLRLLACDSMIALNRSASGTRNGTRNGAISQVGPTVITICNYDKFQRLVGSAKKKLGHEAGREAGQDAQQSFAIPGLFAAEAYNHQTNRQERRSAFQVRKEQKPPHGAKGRGMVWLDHGTAEWNVYAEDYKSVRGADILPETRQGGRGNWFAIVGERQRVRRRR